MAQKCCTLFNDQLCRTNYDATKTHPFLARTKFCFPKDLDEQKQWEISFPNQLRGTLTSKGGITRNLGVYYKHCPLRSLTKALLGGTKASTEPHSVFSSTLSSLFSQTTSKF